MVLNVINAFQIGNDTSEYTELEKVAYLDMDERFCSLIKNVFSNVGDLDPFFKYSFIEEAAMREPYFPENLEIYREQIEDFTTGIRQKELTPISAYAFEEKEMLWFLIVIDEPNVEIEKLYGRVYINVFRKHPNVKFDLMIFGREEIEDIEVPINKYRLPI